MNHYKYCVSIILYKPLVGVGAARSHRKKEEKGSRLVDGYDMIYETANSIILS